MGEMTFPTVEVLLATYNGEPYLRQQIDSIWARIGRRCASWPGMMVPGMERSAYCESMQSDFRTAFVCSKMVSLPARPRVIFFA